MNVVWSDVPTVGTWSVYFGRADGSGFDVEAARHSGSGLGLMSMDERAHVFGGGVEVLSGVARGTTIRVRGAAGPSADA